ncbi:MAG TPA: winged helix-turn-helix domain-containing protein, partial [Dehalococcoidales bacterium]|nr:winged helix-turn-helix domain-containing protein [Dehalococcoidales bacterium]
GFRFLNKHNVKLDAATYNIIMLDMGPASVDGWLAGLVAAELGVEEGGILDIDARELVLDGQRVTLTPLEFGVMNYLYQHEGKAVSRMSLIENIWGYDYDGGSNVTDTVILLLRKKLGEQASVIETVRGVGYRYRGV